MLWFRRKPKPIGQRGEDLAVRHLRKAGYRILDRNVHLGRFEIDVIAQEGDTIAFVEVKTRVDDDIASPEENVHRRKRQHIRSAAHHYLARFQQSDRYYRYDLVSVLFPLSGKPQVTLYRDAFSDRE